MKLLSQLFLLALLPFPLLSMASAQQKNTAIYWSCLFSGYESQLFDAIASEDNTALASHIQCGANINARNAKGRSPLMMAVSNNSLVIAHYLLSKGANPNAGEKLGLTPLKIAAFNGNLAMIELLENYGADIQYGHPSPIECAGRNGDFKVVQYLLERGAQPGLTLIEALKNHHYPVANFLISRNANINVSTWRGTALHLAAEEQNIYLLKWAIRNGINMNATNERGDTALHVAVKAGFIEGAIMLINNNEIDLSVINKMNMTFWDEISSLDSKMANQLLDLPRVKAFLNTFEAQTEVGS